METSKRKDRHLLVCAKKSVEFREKTTLLEEVELIHNALPELDFEKISTKSGFLGKKLSSPLIVNSVTGGTGLGEKFNRTIAGVCQEKGLGMVLGSVKAMLENPSAKKSFKVRGLAPDIFLAANIGAIELKKYSLKKIRNAVEELEVDALSIHLNPAQEIMQSGNVDFSGCLQGIKETAKGMGLPVYVKEVGHGLSGGVCRKLAGTGIKAVDVSGAGGTSFAGVDAIVHGKQIGIGLWDWGIPTAVSVINARKEFKGKVIASGGIRSGIDLAKCIALGASIGGVSLPVVRAYYRKRRAGVEEFLDGFIQELRQAMFLVGAKDCKELGKAKVVVSPRIREWLEPFKG